MRNEGKSTRTKSDRVEAVRQSEEERFRIDGDRWFLACDGFRLKGLTVTARGEPLNDEKEVSKDEETQNSRHDENVDVRNIFSLILSVSL